MKTSLPIKPNIAAGDFRTPARKAWLERKFGAAKTQAPARIFGRHSRRVYGSSTKCRNLVVGGITLLVCGCSTSAGDDNATIGGTGGAGGTGGSTSRAGSAGKAGGNAAGAAGTDSGVCEPLRTAMASIPPVLMFQVDVTGSMEESTASTGGQTKWAATSVALTNAFNALHQNHPDWAVGLTFFARPNATYAPGGFSAVAMAPLGASQLTKLTDAIDNQMLGGNKPTLCAWQAAYADVVSTGSFSAALPAAYAVSPRYVVLVTDGVPTVNRDCATPGPGPQNTITQDEYNYLVQTVQSTGVPNGVKTFVIGVPGSEDPLGAPYDPRCMLSEIAQVGGTASPADCTSTPGVGTCNLVTSSTYCHIDLTTATDFAASLETAITGTVGAQVISCDFSMPSVPDGYYLDPLSTLVTVTSLSGNTVTLTQASSSACSNGDFYVTTDGSDNPNGITLCTAECDAVRGDFGSQVQVQFSCNPVG
jgi:hypothetical protein